MNDRMLADLIEYCTPRTNEDISGATSFTVGSETVYEGYCDTCAYEWTRNFVEFGFDGIRKYVKVEVDFVNFLEWVYNDKVDK